MTKNEVRALILLGEARDLIADDDEQLWDREEPRLHQHEAARQLLGIGDVERRRVLGRREHVDVAALAADLVISEEIEQARLLVLKAAYMMDTVGNKGAKAEIDLSVADKKLLKVLSALYDIYCPKR